MPTIFDRRNVPTPFMHKTHTFRLRFSSIDTDGVHRPLVAQWAVFSGNVSIAENEPRADGACKFTMDDEGPALIAATDGANIQLYKVQVGAQTLVENVGPAPIIGYVIECIQVNDLPE